MSNEPTPRGVENPISSMTTSFQGPTAHLSPLEPQESPIAPNVNGDGRDIAGRFAPGNRAAVAHRNPLASRVARLRSELLKASTPERMRLGVEALWEKFAAGDVAAGKLILSYCLGEPKSLDLIEQVLKLEDTIYRGVASNG